MADLTFNEKRVIDYYFPDYLPFISGFDYKTFPEFVLDITGINISSPRYLKHAKAIQSSQLLKFIELESDYTVGVLLKEIHLYQEAFNNSGKFKLYTDYSPLVAVYERLLSKVSIDKLDFDGTVSDKNFQYLSKLINQSIERNEPEVALDRLHTFLVKFLKELCDQNGVAYTANESVNAIYGKYVKTLRARKLIETIMGEKIIQSTFSVIQEFNDIRNNRSFAHDNTLLQKNESTLIINYIVNTIKFLQSVEANSQQSSGDA